MASASPWTGHTACDLQAALGLSNEAFAERLSISVSTVSGWHKKPDTKPKSDMQEILDTALQQASSAARERFENRSTSSNPPTTASPSAVARLDGDPHIASALDWLDHHTGWTSGTGRERVAAQLAQLDAHMLADRGKQRARVSQSDLTWALTSYYGTAPDGYGRYGAHYNGENGAATTVLTCPEWLDLDCPLLTAADRLTVTSTPPAGALVDERAAEYAVTRLAEALTLDTRLVDMPLYRLQRTDVQHNDLAGQLGVDRFAHYALTMDLLEAELTDTLAANQAARPGSLPLRDRYLPNFPSVLDLENRLCAGGALALCAIARPASPLRGPADYVLLIQERSGHVLNANRQLAVIPKGFHQPLTDYRTDAKLGATLVREMEEELFGRDDIDNTLGDERRADPMHPSLMSEPMRSLSDPGSLHIECTGFGLNLISGNYEFAGLIVIDDDDFWTQYGGRIEANWEAAGLRQYSSLDRELLTELAAEPAWSNEGLFALLQGLRRLANVGGDRVDAPTIEWELW